MLPSSPYSKEVIFIEFTGTLVQKQALSTFKLLSYKRALRKTKQQKG